MNAACLLAHMKSEMHFQNNFKNKGGYSQNFLRKFIKISVTLGLNFLNF